MRSALGTHPIYMRLVAPLLSFLLPLAAETYAPADVKIVGDIDYGKTSEAIDCTGAPYCAVLFNGTSGDEVDVTVASGTRKTYVALADGTLNQLAAGTGRLTFKLPNVGPDLGTYYIVFRDEQKQPGKFTITLKRLTK